MLVLLGLGAIGVVAQLPLLVPMLDEVLATLPDAPDLPLDVRAALSLVDPLVLLLITSTLGLLTAPRVGFRSHLVAWARTGATPTAWPRGELLFGALHLPYARTLHVPTPAIVAEVLLLNGVGGLVYGWLRWRKSLEAAMTAHGTTHVAMTLVALLVLR